MDGTSSERCCSTLPGNNEYDVRNMQEEDYDRLSVYMVPDVPCERGTPMRADKTLPRSLTLKPSLVLSTPHEKVITSFYIENFENYSNIYSFLLNS